VRAVFPVPFGVGKELRFERAVKDCTGRRSNDLSRNDDRRIGSVGRSSGSRARSRFMALVESPSWRSEFSFSLRAGTLSLPGEGFPRRSHNGSHPLRTDEQSCHLNLWLGWSPKWPLLSRRVGGALVGKDFLMVVEAGREEACPNSGGAISNRGAAPVTENLATATFGGPEQ